MWPTLLLLCGGCVTAAGEMNDADRDSILHIALMEQDLQAITDLQLEKEADASPAATPATLYTDTGTSQGMCAASYNKCYGHGECKGLDVDSSYVDPVSGLATHKCVGICVKLNEIQSILERSNLSPLAPNSKKETPEVDPGMPAGFLACQKSIEASSEENKMRGGCCFSGVYNKNGKWGIPKPHGLEAEPHPELVTIHRGCTEPKAQDYCPKCVTFPDGNFEHCTGCKDPNGLNFCPNCGLEGTCEYPEPELKTLDYKTPIPNSENWGTQCKDVPLNFRKDRPDLAGTSAMEKDGLLDWFGGPHPQPTPTPGPKMNKLRFCDESEPEKKEESEDDGGWFSSWFERQPQLATLDADLADFEKEEKMAPFGDIASTVGGWFSGGDDKKKAPEPKKGPCCSTRKCQWVCATQDCTKGKLKCKKPKEPDVCDKDEAGPHLVVIGSPVKITLESGDKRPECLPDSATETKGKNDHGNKIGVTCCKEEGDKVIGKRPGCKQGVGYVEAKCHCKKQGMRLCSRAELESGVATGSGCGFDWFLDWSSNTCDGQGEDKPSWKLAATCSPPEKGPHWVTVGRKDGFEHTSNGNKEDECLDNDAKTSASSNKYGNKIGVTCCKMDGSSGSRPACFGQESGATFAEASCHCEKHGMRLCSKQEIKQKHLGERTGCNFDAFDVWTNDKCTKPAVKEEITGGGGIWGKIKSWFAAGERDGLSLTMAAEMKHALKTAESDEQLSPIYYKYRKAANMNRLIKEAETSLQNKDAAGAKLLYESARKIAPKDARAIVGMQKAAKEMKYLDAVKKTLNPVYLERVLDSASVMEESMKE